MDKNRLKQIQTLLKFKDHLPHRDNLIHKLSLPQSNSEAWSIPLKIIYPNYLDFINTITNYSSKLDKSLNSCVNILNQYLDLLNLKENNIFSHQSDFKSSVLADFLSVLLNRIINEKHLPFILSTQKDVIFDCQFDALNNGRIIFKRKKTDIAIIFPKKLIFSEREENNFAIPIAVVETKTNMDKNMLSGIEHSADSLKRTFPRCLYLAVSELSDFNLEAQNYASTKIDDIYIIRKQKRVIVRKTGIQNKIDLNVIKEITVKISNHLALIANPVEDLHTRMMKGRLIGGKKNVF